MMKTILWTALATLAASTLSYAQHPDEVNYFSGISVDFSGTQGVDYAEEYMYYDTLTTDRRVVYIKEDTTITFTHNERNNVANGYSGYFTPIGVDGWDGVPNSGDEGQIRYKVDYDLNSSYNYSDSNAVNLFPLYSTPLSFAGLTYPDSAISVLGSTGHSSGDLTDKTQFYQGIIGPFGDEWHTIQFWDDDESHLEPIGQKRENWASDGKQLIFVVNPKTPALQIWTSGDAQYYTTPAKTYHLPKIHEQTTYIAEGTGSVSLQLIDINGNDVHYRINGGSFTNAGSNSVTLTHADFNAGANTLEYYYAGNVAYTKTRTVVRNPAHPSLAETHGKFLWENSQTIYDEWLARVTAGEEPYAATILRMKGSNRIHAKNYWNAHGRDGSRRYLYLTDPSYTVEHPASAFGVFANTILALLEGFDARYWSSETLPTYGEYATGMILSIPWFRIEPIGWEGDHSQGAYPSKEVISAGYYNVNQIVDVCMSYDIIAGNFRSDQVVGGMTPIEDLYVRDGLARWVVMCMMELRSVTDLGERSGGLWDTAKWSGSLMIAMCLNEYSTAYYGTSGYGVLQTGYEYAPFIGDSPTWKEAFWETPTEWTLYPGRGRKYSPEPANLFDENADWTGPNAGYFDVMNTSFCILMNLTRMYDPRAMPILEQAISDSIDGQLPYPGGTIQGYFPLLVNDRFPEFAGKTLAQMNNDEIWNRPDAGNLLGFIWYDNTVTPASAVSGKRLKRAGDVLQLAFP